MTDIADSSASAFSQAAKDECWYYLGTFYDLALLDRRRHLETLAIPTGVMSPHRPWPEGFHFCKGSRSSGLSPDPNESSMIQHDSSLPVVLCILRRQPYTPDRTHAAAYSQGYQRPQQPVNPVPLSAFTARLRQSVVLRPNSFPSLFLAYLPFNFKETPLSVPLRWFPAEIGPLAVNNTLSGQ